MNQTHTTQYALRHDGMTLLFVIHERKRGKSGSLFFASGTPGLEQGCSFRLPLEIRDKWGFTDEHLFVPTIEYWNEKGYKDPIRVRPVHFAIGFLRDFWEAMRVHPVSWEIVDPHLFTPLEEEKIKEALGR